MFEEQILIGTIMIIATVIFHTTALGYLANILKKLTPSSQVGSTRFHTICILTISVLAIVGVHTFEAWSWSVAYFTLGEFTDLNQSLYFSVVTFTTLGYGEITCPIAGNSWVHSKPWVD